MAKREIVGRLKTKHDPKPKPKKKQKNKSTKICGAKTKRGTLCGVTALGPYGRCRIHGGFPKKGGHKKKNKEKAIEATKKKNTVHGIYADVALLDDEYPIYPGIQGKIGTLDEELHTARIMLRRSLKGQCNLEAVKDDLARAAYSKDEFIRVALSHKLLTVDEVEDTEDQSIVGSKEDRYLENIAKSKMVRKIQDYSKNIHKFTELIKRLEQARKEILETEDWGEDFVRRLAEDLRKFSIHADQALSEKSPIIGSGSYDHINPAYVTQ